MDPMPLAGTFCVSIEEASATPKFELTWVQCTTCGLLQVFQDLSDELLFTRYNYSSSSIPGLVKHFKQFANDLGVRYGAETAVRYLEVGCNDGVLLTRLPKDWELHGVDPSDVAKRGTLP